MSVFFNDRQSVSSDCTDLIVFAIAVTIAVATDVPLRYFLSDSILLYIFSHGAAISMNSPMFDSDRFSFSLLVAATAIILGESTAAG